MFCSYVARVSSSSALSSSRAGTPAALRRIPYSPHNRASAPAYFPQAWFECGRFHPGCPPPFQESNGGFHILAEGVHQRRVHLHAHHPRHAFLKAQQHGSEVIEGVAAHIEIHGRRKHEVAWLRAPGEAGARLVPRNQAQCLEIDRFQLFQQAAQQRRIQREFLIRLSIYSK